MNLDDYRDLWIEALERHQDDGEGWEENLMRDWQAVCAARGLSKGQANGVAAALIDEGEEFANQTGMNPN